MEIIRFIPEAVMGITNIEIVSNAFEIAASLADCIIIGWFLINFLERKKEFTKFYQFLFVMIGFLNNHFLEDYYLAQSIIFILIMFCVERLFLVGKIGLHLLISSIITVGIIFINLGFILGISLLTGHNPSTLMENGSSFSRIVLLCAAKLTLFFVAYLVLLKSNRKGKFNDDERILISTMYIMILVVVVMFSKFFGEMKMTHGQQSWFVINTLLLIGINIIACLLILKINRKNELEMKNTVLNVQIEEQKRMISNTEKLYNETRLIRHDLKNYINTILHLMKNGDLELAIKQMEELSNTKFRNEYVYFIDNKLMNAVINGKHSICTENDIRFELQISGEIKSFDDMELAIMLSNLLDNAIEAEKKLDTQRSVVLKIFEHKNSLNIIVENKILDSVLEKNPLLATDKNDYDKHGLGIYSITETVKKYNGAYDMSESDGKFIVHIMLTNNL